MAAGIVSWGVYLPYWRLDRGAIGAAFGTAAGQGDPGGRLLRRGHHHPRGGGGPPGVGRRRGPGPRRPLLLDPGAGLPGQDQRHHHPRRLGAAGQLGGLRPRRLGAVGVGHPHPVGAERGATPGDGGHLRPAHRPGRGSGGEPGRGRRGGLRLRPRGRGGRGDRPGVGHRRVPRPLAGARRVRLPPVGGALRRGGLPARRPVRLRRGARRGRAQGRRRRPSGGGRAPRPGGGLAAEGAERDRRSGRPRLRAPDREPRRRPGRAGPGRRVGAGHPGPGDRGGRTGRRGRRPGAPDHRRAHRGASQHAARPAR